MSDLTKEDIAYHISDDEIKSIIEAVRAQDTDTVANYLTDLSAANTADLIAKIPDEDRAELLAMYSEFIVPFTFLEMDRELVRISLTSMPVIEIASMISKLESDDALEIITALDDDLQQDVIRKLSAKMRAAVQEGLAFPEDSAGRLMQREFVAVPQFWSVGRTIDYLRAAADDLPEDFFDVFIINPAYHMKGQIPLNKLVRANRDEKLQDLTLDESHPIPANMDQEEVAHIFRRDDIGSAPVLDENNRLIGVITIDDVVDVIDEEAQEDILRLAGVDQGDLYRAVWSTTGTRFRWLFVNLLTAIAASLVISAFETTIQEIVALAVLMPIVASMGGNAGTQALTVAVRALATRQLSKTNMSRIIWKEALVGSLNGIAFAVITGIISALWFSNPMLGGVIAAAMIINLCTAGIFGAAIPILLDKMGSDPAISSTVLLTTVTDIVGFFAFLGLAALVLF